MTHLFIINPAAGSRNRSREYSRIIADTCRRRKINYRIEVSRSPGHCRKLAEFAAKSGKEYRIYACGGDGTLNEIVSGIAGAPNVAVTLFAAGSGNDFIRIFNDPKPFRDLNALLDCEEARFDLIACNNAYALNIMSVGLDARVGTNVASFKRIPLLQGFRAYALSALISVIKGIGEHYRVEINGRTVDREQTLVCACNGRYYGGGFNPVPEADPCDGMLDVLLVKKVSRVKVAAAIKKYKNGQYAHFPDLIHHEKTNHLVIHCDKPTPVNLDGELQYAEVLDIRVIPKAIRFFYPKGLTYNSAGKK